MDKEITKFGDIEVEKHKFHQYKSSNSIKNVDISKTVVSKSASFGKKVLNFLFGTKMITKLDLYL